MIKALFSLHLTQETYICDPIDHDDDDLNLENSGTIMQQCLDKDLRVVVLKPSPSDIKSIFKLKNLARTKRSSIEFQDPYISIVHLETCNLCA